MKTVLLSGFQPFLGESLNPSQLIIESISRESEFSEFVETLLLPVSFKRAHEVLLSKLDELSEIQLVLMLGQASGRSKVSLERVALNWVETENKDEESYLPSAGPIVERGERAFFSDLPLDQILKKLKNLSIPAEISPSAGSFVCNHLYYQVASRLKKNQKALFVHVPFLPDQVNNKPPGTPSMPLETMVQAIMEVLSFTRECRAGRDLRK